MDRTQKIHENLSVAGCYMPVNQHHNMGEEEENTGRQTERRVLEHSEAALEAFCRGILLTSWSLRKETREINTLNTLSSPTTPAPARLAGKPSQTADRAADGGDNEHKLTLGGEKLSGD